MNRNLKYKLKTLIIAILVIVMSLGNVMYINANTLEIGSKSAILINADTGEIIYQKEPYTQRQIASVSKIMTGLLVIEEGNLDDKVYITANSANVGGTSFKIDEGMIISRRDLLHGLLYISGNDAGDALARTSSLGYEGFINKMNAKAASLGMVGTRFYDPHGLGSYGKVGAGNNYSTAYDLAQLMKAAMSNPQFAMIQKTTMVSTENPNYPTLENNNAFMKEYQGAIGAKTGYTANAGNCQVAAANRNGKTLVAVVLNAPKGMRDKDVVALMDYGFGVPNNTLEPSIKNQPTITTLPATNNMLVDLLG